MAGGRRFDDRDLRISSSRITLIGASVSAAAVHPNRSDIAMAGLVRGWVRGGVTLPGADPRVLNRETLLVRADDVFD